MFLEACLGHPVLSLMALHIFIQNQKDNIAGIFIKSSYINPDKVFNKTNERTMDQNIQLQKWNEPKVLYRHPTKQKAGNDWMRSPRLNQSLSGKDPGANILKNSRKKQC